VLKIKNMNLKPLSNHVVIEPEKEETVTKSGIVLPESAEKERPMKGKIIAVGPGKLNDKGERIPMSVKVGDVVIFKKYGPDEIEIEDKKYLVGDEDDILAIVE
jgi:chaperonin GroES